MLKINSVVGLLQFFFFFINLHFYQRMWFLQHLPKNWTSLSKHRLFLLTVNLFPQQFKSVKYLLTVSSLNCLCIFDINKQLTQKDLVQIFLRKTEFPKQANISVVFLLIHKAKCCITLWKFLTLACKVANFVI